MSSRYYVSYRIGGDCTAAKWQLLGKLVELGFLRGAEELWGPSASPPPLQLETTHLHVEHAEWGSFQLDDLTGWLIDTGLAFNRYVGGDGEYDGDQLYYRPGQPNVEYDCNSNGAEVVYVQAVRDAMNDPDPDTLRKLVQEPLPLPPFRLVP